MSVVMHFANCVNGINLCLLFLQMSLTIQQILSDAKRLASRLKEHDTAADELLTQTQSVYKQLDAMKQVSQHKT